MQDVAEREGFEPSVEFPLHTLSKRAPSTTRTSLRASGISSLAEVFYHREPGSTPPRPVRHSASNGAETVRVWIPEVLALLEAVAADGQRAKGFGSLLARPECAAELVGERSEALGRRGVRAFGVLAQLLGLLRILTALRLRRMRRPDGSTSSTMTSTSLPTGNAFATSASLATPVSLERHQPGAARGEEHEHAELLVTLDLAGEARARRDRRTATAPPRPARVEPSARARRRSASCPGSMLRISKAPVMPTGDRPRPAVASAGRRERGGVRQRLRRPARARRTRRTRRRA